MATVKVKKIDFFLTKKNSNLVDLSQVNDVGKSISKYIKTYKIIVTKSTVPVATGDQIEKIIISNGLKLLGDFLEKNILKPNNINYPSSRLEFIKLLK